jgi:SynChlorMet cassette radical SAM/SPASM protein ScmF
MPTELQLPAGVPPLRTYYIYMTGACNLACRHCWIAPSFLHGGEDASEKSLPFELFEQAIREGEPLGLNHVKFTGGEPFVHPDVQRMLDYAAERQLGVTIETNGTLITAERARYLREKVAVRSISVSLDGATASTHDYLRGVTGSFVQAQAGIKHLVEAGYHPQVIMSLYEGNLDEVEPLAQWATAAGCSSLKLNIIQETGRGGFFEERVQGIQRLIELGRWVETEVQARVTIPLYYSWPPAFQRLGRLSYRAGCNSCDIFNILGILHSGHLALCGIGVQDENLVYGLLGKDSVAEVWTTHPIILQIRENVPQQLERICGNCLLREVCMGFCVADNYHRTGNLLAPFWFCDVANRAGLFPARRIRQPGYQDA